MEASEVMKLRCENSELRTELAAQQAVYQKLKIERDQLSDQLRASNDMIRQLQEELSLREQMFQEMQRNKDNEIANIKQMKRDVEMRLENVLNIEADGQNTNEDMDSYTSKLVLPNLTASQVIDSLSEWDGMENTISLFEDLAMSESDHAQWKPGSPWESNWKFSVNLYISAAADVADTVEVFLREYMPEINARCSSSGFFLTPVHVHYEMLKTENIKDEEVSRFSLKLLQEANIFLSILKDELNHLSKSEVENGYLNSPSSSNAIFVFLPQESPVNSRSQMSKLRDRISKCSKDLNNIIECGQNFTFGFDEVKKRILEILSKKFGMLEEATSDNTNVVFERISLLEDMRLEYEQRCILRTVHLRTVPLQAISVVNDKLNKYVREDPPIVSVCLLSGQPGSGKSTILSNWIKQWTESGEAIVLYHFVKFLSSTSAEASVFYRRILQQIQFLCNDTAELPKRPSKLADMFLPLLEKLSASSKRKTIIVIDNVDLIKKCDLYFGWMVKPLPSGIRIVVSCDEESCPSLWRVLPSPPIPSFHTSDIVELITGLQLQHGTTVLSEDQISLLTLSDQNSPLWCVLVAKHLLNSLTNSCADSDFVYDVVESYVEYEGITELLHHIFEDLEKRSAGLYLQTQIILQLLYWSRNGLMFHEIMQELNISTCVLAFLLYELLRRCIICYCGGLYYIQNLQVQEAVQGLLCTDPLHDYMLLWTSPLLSIFGARTSLMCRRGEELPWLLQRVELKEELYYAILNVDTLIYLFASSRVGELLEYWMYLDYDEKTLSSQYFKAIRDMENEETTNSQSFFISLYWTVGKIIEGLEHYEEALQLFQHSLELCESHANPDSLKIAWIMVDLAKLHYMTGRLETSEGYFRESLHVFEMIHNEDSPQMIQILEEFQKVVSKLNKPDLMDGISSRIFAIKQSILKSPNANTLLGNKVAYLESSLSNVKLSSIEQAKQLNEYGVILSVYGDFSCAEKYLMEALDILDSSEDLYVTVVLKNLAKLYSQHERFDLATTLYAKALEVAKQSYSDERALVFQLTEKLAYLYRQQGLMDHAIPLQRCVINYLAEEFGEEHFCIAEALNNLAVLHCHVGEYPNAVPLLKKAIDIYKLNLGESHPLVISALDNLKVAGNN